MEVYHLVYFVLLLLICQDCKGDCVWYDQCGEDPEFNDGKHGLNCVYNGPPSEFFEKFLDLDN